MKKILLFVCAMALLWTVTAEAGTQVSCLTSTTVIDTGDRTRILATFQSENTSNPVWICPTATCTVSTADVQLPAGTANGLNLVWFEGWESVSDWSCISTGGTVIINYSEKTK